VGTLGYLASLPFGPVSYRRYARRARESKMDVPAVAAASSAPTPGGVLSLADDDEERPSRLN
jgi:hypothetical protein